MKRPSRSNFLLRLTKCDLGATAVEFALVAWIFILFVLGIIEVGRALDVRNQISRAADAGSRKVMVATGVDPEGDARTAAKAALTTADPNDLIVTVTSETVDGLDYRKITVSYPFKPMLAGIIAPVPLSVERLICPATECASPSP